MALPARTNQTQVSRMDPMAELNRVQDRLSHLIDVWSWPSFFEDGAALADVEETDDAYLVELDLPGVDKSDIEIQLVGHRLIVSGVRKERERKGVLRHRTRTVDFGMRSYYPVTWTLHRYQQVWLTACSPCVWLGRPVRSRRPSRSAAAEMLVVEPKRSRPVTANSH